MPAATPDPADLQTVLPPAAPAEPPTVLPGQDPTLAATIDPGPLAGGAAVDAPAPPGYEILGELGRGGMGVVYKAKQVALNRVVALKMILAGGHAGAELRRRFLAEAQAVAKLKHPHIVQVFDLGEHQGHPYFALEFVAGGSLDKQLAGTPLPPQDAAMLVATLADAMAHAHAAGIVHRDLKPANVLVEAGWAVKVMDFGLAKTLDTDSGQTKSGSIMGTPSYMAPEQAQGRKDVGPPADVYALGAILYECLTGRPPFKAATPLDTVLQVLDQEPVPPTQLQPQTPRDLETIALKCLAKEPGRRYGSAQALADDLRRYLAGEPIRARPASVLERSGKWVRRNRAVTAAAAGIAAALTLGLGLALWQGWRADAEAERAGGEAERARTAELTAQGQAAALAVEKARAERQLARAEWLVYQNRLGEVGRYLEEGRREAAYDRLTDCNGALRGWEFHRLWTQLQGDCLILRDPTAWLLAVAFSPDGTRLATAGSDGAARLWDAHAGTLLANLQGHTGAVWKVAFSPDGARLATAGSDGVARLWDARIGAPLGELRGHRGKVEAVAFSPDGTRLATAGEDQTARLWDAHRATPSPN
jgi:hypothetical protein